VRLPVWSAPTLEDRNKVRLSWPGGDAPGLACTYQFFANIISLFFFFLRYNTTSRGDSRPFSLFVVERDIAKLMTTSELPDISALPPRSRTLISVFQALGAHSRPAISTG